jgi:hypothetical protein
MCKRRKKAEGLKNTAGGVTCKRNQPRQPKIMRAERRNAPAIIKIIIAKILFALF